MEYIKVPDISKEVTNRVRYKYGKYKIIILEECKDCSYYELITHNVAPYSFCRRQNYGFSGEEPDSFFKCRRSKL